MLYLRATAGLVAPILVDGVVPAWLLAGDDHRFGLGVVRIIGLPFMAFGAWLLLDCVFLRFAREGRGTLVPIDPPKFVVRGGPYRYVRNPMYVGNVVFIVGFGLLVGSWRVLAWALVAFAAFNVFVFAYEEPTLRRLFGDEYEAYRASVGRWWPRRNAHAAR